MKYITKFEYDDPFATGDCGTVTKLIELKKYGSEYFRIDNSILVILLLSHVIVIDP